MSIHNPNKDAKINLSLESLKKFIQGLNYGIILKNYGRNSRQSNEFIASNPNAEENLLFTKDIIKKVFPEI